MRTTRSRAALLALLLAGGTLAAACGGDDDGGDATAAADNETDAGGSTADGSATVATADTDFGEVLVDADGMTLYAFTPDTEGTPTCTEACADAWPPATVEGEPEVADGLDAATFTVVEHPETGDQLKAGDWPLYRFAGDSAPGDVNGQGSGGVWFVVDADGELVEDTEGGSAAGTSSSSSSGSFGY